MPPTDEEMIRHFATHEAAFDKIRKIMAESSEGSFHYPPLSLPAIFSSLIRQDKYPTNRTKCRTRRYTGYQDLTEYNSTPCCQRLDAVLSLLTAGEQETADSVYVSLFMLYYSHGIVDAGTSKSFVYDLELRSRRDIRITEHGDLNKIYRRTYNDTTLYKPVKEGWYIELDHSR